MGVLLTGAALAGCNGIKSEQGQTPENADSATVQIPYVTLNNGNRLVDCAQGYQNEAEVWQGIKESGVDRSEVFITSKVSPVLMEWCILP